MTNFARSLFFGALAAAVISIVAGRWWALLACCVTAGAALALFLYVTRNTREAILPLRRVLRAMYLTKAGWGAVFFVVFILVSAIQSGANLLFFLASAMAGCIAASVLYAPLALRRTTVTVTLPAWAFAGEAATAYASAVNSKRILPIVALRLRGDADGKGPIEAAVPSLPAGASARVEFAFTPSRRGTARSAEVEMSTSGLAGLASRARRVTLAVATTVYPSPAAVSLPAVVRRPHERGRAAMAREGDFAGLKEWRPGDSPKHIHWRSSARVGRLVAREFTLTERPEVVIVLDTLAAEGEAFEAAVSRAAGYAVAAARASLRVRLVYFDTALRMVDDDASGGLPHRALRALAEARAQSAVGLDETLRLAALDGRAAAVIEVRVEEPRVEHSGEPAAAEAVNA